MAARHEPKGYATIVEPGRPTVELDSIACFHCGRVVFLKAEQYTVVDKRKPGAKPLDCGASQDIGGFCRVCMRSICGPCCDIGSCTPWEKQMEAMERREQVRRGLGI